MFIFEKILELYRNELISMLQINALTLLFAFIFFEYWKGRKNPLSQQVLERMKKGNKKGSKNLDSTEIFNKVLSKFGRVEKKAELYLAQANLEFTAKEYVTFFVFGVLGGAALGFIIFPFPDLFKLILFFIDDSFIQISIARILSTVTFASLGTLTPYIWTKRLVSKRRKALEEQLLDFLMSLADGVKSSPTVQDALDMVAKEMPDPLSSEIKKAVQGLHYAKPFEEVMGELADRINIKEYTLAINAMQIQNKTGGELEKLLRNMAKVFQERQELIAEVKKIVRGPKTTSYILLAAPFLFVMMFSFLSEDFFGTLLSSGIGWAIVIASVILYVIAFLLIVSINKYVDKVV